MHAKTETGKLTEVDTEAGTLFLEWEDYRTGIQNTLRFNFPQDLQAEWEDLIGLKVDVVTIDDEVTRVTVCNEETK